MNPLALRKRLLIAESELNRAQLFAEWEAMEHGVLDLARRARVVADWATAAGLLLSAIRFCRRCPPATPAADSSWFRRILSFAQMGATLWSALRQGREKKQGS